MSDPMCGPSTAFKGLIDHQNRDRSLQQEARGVQQAPQSNTFRSNATNGSQEDRSFASFIDHGSSLQFINTGLDLRVGASTAIPPSHAAAAQLTVQPSHLSNAASQQPNANPRAFAVLPVANDRSLARHPQAFASPVLAAHMYGQNMPHIHQAATLSPVTAPLANFQAEMDRWVAANTGVAGNSVQAVNNLDAEHDFSEVNDIMDQLAEDLARDIDINVPDPLPPVNSLRVETDATLPTMESAQKEKEDQNIQKQNSSDISEVARQILTSVEHEEDDKWKNSSFLALMKDFRDGNKEILNDEILERK